MAKGQRNDTTPANYVRVTALLAMELYQSPTRRAFQFLNRDGEVMTVKEGSDGDAYPIQEEDWIRAKLTAEQIDARFIVSFNTRKILFRVLSPSDTPMWYPAVVGVDDFSYLNNAERVPYEPQANGSQPSKRKRPSGAQNRKRYGY